MISVYHELLNADWEGCRIEQDLPLFGQEAQHFLHHNHKVLRQEFVSLLSKETQGKSTAIERTLQL